MNRLSIRICDLLLKSPVMNASGVAGHSNELEGTPHFKYDDLGAFVTKGVSLNPKEGNPQSRIAESSSGMLNSIGLQNKGLDYFMEEQLPKLYNYNIPIIVNIAAGSIGEFDKLCEDMKKYDSFDVISAVEVNLSCPNVSEGGILLGTDPLTVKCIIRDVRDILDYKLIIAKLTPNVNSIVEIAEAAIQGGVDALTMINTVRGCAVDINIKSHILGNIVGGLSGPAIKPMGLLAVYECFNKIPQCKSKKIPIIGVGGISSFEDALEYFMVGASAVQIGTGFFGNPGIFNIINRELDNYLEDKKLVLSDIIGIIGG